MESFLQESCRTICRWNGQSLEMDLSQHGEQELLSVPVRIPKNCYRECDNVERPWDKPSCKKCIIDTVMKREEMDLSQEDVTAVMEDLGWIRSVANGECRVSNKQGNWVNRCKEDEEE